MNMKKFFGLLAVAFLCVGIMGCAKEEEQVEVEAIYVTKDNVDAYLVKLGAYEGLTVSAQKQVLTDALVEYYAEVYYMQQASRTPGMTDVSGNVLPFTDENVKKLGHDAYTDVNEFMLFSRDTVDEYLEYLYENEVVSGMIDQIEKTSVFAEISEGLLVPMREAVKEDYAETAAKYENMSSERYLSLAGTSLDEEAMKYLKKELIYVKIAKENGIETENREFMNEEVFNLLFRLANIK